LPVVGGVERSSIEKTRCEVEGVDMSVALKSSVVALSALGLIGAVAATGSGEAFAGTDGQHVEIINKRGDNLKGGWVKGTNWAGQYVQQWVGVQYYPDARDQEGDSYWWWKGTIQIDWVKNDSASSYAGTTTCQVPTSQQSDWSYCTRF
jgi:hypothetical protein